LSYESWHTYFLLLEFPALDVDAFLAGAFLADEFDFFEVDAFAVLFDVLGPDVDASFAAPFFAPSSMTLLVSATRSTLENDMT